MFQQTRIPAFAIAFVSNWLFVSSSDSITEKISPGFVQALGVKRSWQPKNVYSCFHAKRVSPQTRKTRISGFQRQLFNSSCLSSPGFAPKHGVKRFWPLTNLSPLFPREACFFNEQLKISGSLILFYCRKIQ